MATEGGIAPKGPWAQPITIHLRGHEVAVSNVKQDLVTEP